MRRVSLVALLLGGVCSTALAATFQDKGNVLPERMVDLVVDIDNRFIEEEFAGDADAARVYITNVLFSVRVILNQDLNITLNVKEIVVWEDPAPFELDASEDPSFSDVFETYRDYVWDNRADSLPTMFQLFTGYVESFGGLRTLALVSQPCNGVSALAAFASDTFPAGPGSVDVIFSARGLGRNLGAATNTTDPSVMAATITGSTPLLFLPESITAIGNRLAVGDCWAPAVVEGEGAGDGEGDSPIEICNDTIDNDENGFTDCNDFACVDSEFCAAETSCGDEIDNDENGFTDCDDFACAESEFCTGETSCGDDIDNDENGFTDCDDFNCVGSPACTEGEGAADGEGQPSEGQVDGEGSLDGEGESQPANQSADTNLDFFIDLSELLRVVQFYNSQGIHCSDANSEDGYVPGENNTAQQCSPHTSDYAPQDWTIILTELLQLIQLYNAEGYQPCQAPEGFCPVLP